MFTKEFIKKFFPSLFKEIESNAMSKNISGIRTENFDNYEPDIIDFLRRCKNEKEGKEVIEYMKKEGKISEDYAKKLIKQLEDMGIRSFGKKKEWGWYK